MSCERLARSAAIGMECASPGAVWAAASSGISSAPVVTAMARLLRKRACGICALCVMRVSDFVLTNDVSGSGARRSPVGHACASQHGVPEGFELHAFVGGNHGAS